MKRLGKIIILSLTFVMPLYLIFFMGFFISTAFSMVSKSAVQSFNPNWFVYIFPVHIGVMLLNIGLMVLYIVHAFKNDALTSDKRILWVIVLFFGGMIAMPIYWFLYIWRSPAKIMTGDSA